jgi:hypothetical protein
MNPDTPEDFDPIDFILWRPECALADAAPSVSDLTREVLVIAQLRIEEERARRVA